MDAEKANEIKMLEDDLDRMDAEDAAQLGENALPKGGGAINGELVNENKKAILPKGEKKGEFSGGEKAMKNLKISQGQVKMTLNMCLEEMKTSHADSVEKMAVAFKSFATLVQNSVNELARNVAGLAEAVDEMSGKLDSRNDSSDSSDTEEESEGENEGGGNRQQNMEMGENIPGEGHSGNVLRNGRGNARNREGHNGRNGGDAPNRGEGNAGDVRNRGEGNARNRGNVVPRNRGGGNGPPRFRQAGNYRQQQYRDNRFPNRENRYGNQRARAFYLMRQVDRERRSHRVNCDCQLCREGPPEL
jgi:hypothetical protein